MYIQQIMITASFAKIIEQAIKQANSGWSDEVVIKEIRRDIISQFSKSTHFRVLKKEKIN